MKKFGSVIFTALFLLCLTGLSNAQPNPPTNLTAVQGSWQNFFYVKLTWQADKKMPMNQIHFNVYRKDGAISDTGSFKKIYIRVPMDTWMDKFVRRGQTYSYYVTAVDRFGESSSSDTVEISLDSSVVKATVAGTLKDKNTGSAITNGRVTFIPVFGWGMTNVKLDSTGSFSAQLFPGTYLIYASAPGYFPEYYNNVRDIFNAEKITLKQGDSLSFDVTLTPKAPPQKFMLSGTVKDSSGNPIKAAIEIFNVAFNTFSHRSYRTLTDSAGNYSVQVRQGDTLVAFARSLDKQYYPEFYNNKNSFMDADRIPVTQDVTNIDFILQHKPVYNNGISGTVDNSNGDGVSAVVYAIRLGVKVDFEHRRFSTLTDSLGNYEIANLYPGNYILLTIPQDDYLPTFFRYDSTQTMHWKDADSVAVDSTGIITGINFTVRAIPDSGANMVSGKVVDNSGSPVNGAMVFATDENQDVYSYGITNQNGNYTITGLVPGSYSVSTDKYGYTSTQTSAVSLDYSSSYSSTASFSISPETVTSVKQNNVVINNFELNQNYPNPFNPTTIISFTIPNESRVTLKVFNILGKEVATLLDGEKSAGNYNITFNGSNLASGVYFYQLRAGNFTSTKKLILMK